MALALAIIRMATLHTPLFILLPSPLGEGSGGEAFTLHASFYSPRLLERGRG